MLRQTRRSLPEVAGSMVGDVPGLRRDKRRET